MKDLHIRKLCLNICVGESGDKLTRAAKVPFLMLINMLLRSCTYTSLVGFDSQLKQYICAILNCFYLQPMPTCSYWVCYSMMQTLISVALVNTSCLTTFGPIN